MNPIFIVLPILALLMFDLGLMLRLEDFKRIAQRPKAVVVGEIGQLIVLPALAFALAWLFRLEPIFFIGMVLIGCCPGGSSSNVFSMLAKGDVALSVTLTALSSLITLLTVPFILSIAVNFCHWQDTSTIQLPVGNLLVQNLVLMFLPIVLGYLMRKYAPKKAEKTEHVLSKMAFPALMLLAGIFFVQHYRTIGEHFATLGLCVGGLILLAMMVAAMMAKAFCLNKKEHRTIIIEMGMQNAAQAIAIAASPFIFANDAIAIPAIIYALLMNVILLTYVGIIKHRKSD